MPTYLHEISDQWFNQKFQVKDLVLSLKALIKQLGEDQQLTVAQVEAFLEQSNYQVTQDPTSIPDSAGEVMVYCDYYLVHDL